MKSKILYYFIRRLNSSLKKNRINPKNKIIAHFNDQLGEQIQSHGFYEFFYLKNIIPYLNDHIFSHILLDVGANIGNHSVFFSNYFYRIYSFEPQKTTYKILEINTERIENIKTFNYGISSSNLKQQLFINSKNRGMVSRRKLDEFYFNEEVKFKPHLFKKNDTISYIKIDVEGNEVDVLSSLKNKILADKPIISFEFNDTFTKSNIKSLLKSLGYDNFYVFNNDYVQRKKRKFFIKNPNKLRKIELNNTDDYSMVFTFCEKSQFKLITK